MELGAGRVLTTIGHLDGVLLHIHEKEITLYRNNVKPWESKRPLNGSSGIPQTVLKQGKNQETCILLAVKVMIAGCTCSRQLSNHGCVRAAADENMKFQDLD